MSNLTRIKQRYMQDDLPTRLGGIAANLARVGSFSRNPANREVVRSLLDESKYFIEWSAPDAEIEQATKLVELQVQLASWQQDWVDIWDNESERNAVSEHSLRWSDQVLAISGLLEEA
jgi:hypothetical protein